MAAKNIFRIPLFLTARTPQELSEVMLQNNIKWKREFDYFQILQTSAGWMAWYYNSVEVKNGEVKDADTREHQG